MKRVRVYVAGSYSADNIIGVLNNIHRGTKMCAALLKKGYAPFCPWLDYQFQFYDISLTVDDYRDYSMMWLEVSDVVLVLENSEKSKGTQAEIKRAEQLRIPIVHSVKELDINWGG
jgi:hypothetical protein